MRTGPNSSLGHTWPSVGAGICLLFASAAPGMPSSPSESIDASTNEAHGSTDKEMAAPITPLLILNDGAEHGQCFSTRPLASRPHPAAYFTSTCADDQEDGVRVSPVAAHSGTFGYELVVTGKDTHHMSPATAIGTAKMTASQLITMNQPVSATLRYEAWFLIASGFNDTAWHIQMQWKGQKTDNILNDRYWTGQNPKIALGFMRRESRHRQVEVIIRDADPDRCDSATYNHYTRRSTLKQPALPVEDNTWTQLIIEIHFDIQHGYVKVWQSNGQQAMLIIDAREIDTVSQVIDRHISKPSDHACKPGQDNASYRTRPTHLSFGLANYLSAESFRYTSHPHVIYIDDISITRLQ